MSRPVNLSPETIAAIQQKYSDVANYENFDEPIDPVSYRAPDDDRLIHIAVRRDDIGTVALLLDAGVDINIQGDMGYTPLHEAISQNNLDMIALLLRRGARTDIKNEFGYTSDELLSMAPRLD